MDKDRTAGSAAVLALAGSSKGTIIAQDVESFEGIAFLRARHCDKARDCDERLGYYFRPPVPRTSSSGYRKPASASRDR
jgi:hypothetical protein